MITTIGVSYILFNLVLLFLGANPKNYPNPLPPLTFAIGGAVLRLREVLIWILAVVLMLGLFAFTRGSRMGKGDEGHGAGSGGGADDGRERRRRDHDRVLHRFGAGRGRGG